MYSVWQNYMILCFWLRASLIYINNCPKRCNTNQSIYYSDSSLYMFRVSTTPIIRRTQNCNYSLRYWSYFLFSYLPPTWPSLSKLNLWVSIRLRDILIFVTYNPGVLGYHNVWNGKYLNIFRSYCLTMDMLAGWSSLSVDKLLPMNAVYYRAFRKIWRKVWTVEIIHFCQIDPMGLSTALAVESSSIIQSVNQFRISLIAFFLWQIQKTCNVVAVSAIPSCCMKPWTCPAPANTSPHQGWTHAWGKAISEALPCPGADWKQYHTSQQYKDNRRI